MKPLLAALLAAIALFFGYQQLDGKEDQRALFIGNSLTFGNDLPSMVANVLGENGIDLEVEMIATGGRTLSQHAVDPAVRSAIASGDFDFVVLQEQSEYPAVAQLLSNDSSPAAEALGGMATAAGAEVILFETWGHRNGSTNTGHTSYESMQAALTQGYWHLADVANGVIAPVGTTWSRSLENNDIVLYEPDGYHPSVAGSHLASLVIARTVLGEALTGFPTNGLPDDQADQLAALVW